MLDGLPPKREKQMHGFGFLRKYLGRIMLELSGVVKGIIPRHGIRTLPTCYLRLVRARIGYEVVSGPEGLGWSWLRRVTGDNL